MFKVLSSLQGNFLMFNQSEMKLIEYPSLSLSESCKPFTINLCWCFYSIWFDYIIFLECMLMPSKYGLSSIRFWSKMNVGIISKYNHAEEGKKSPMMTFDFVLLLL